MTEPPTEPTTPWQNTPERLELDRWHAEQRLANERLGWGITARGRAIDVALFFYRDVAKRKLFGDEVEAATPEQLVATAALFHEFIAGVPE